MPQSGAYGLDEPYAGRYGNRLERSGLAGTLQKMTCTGVLRWACQAPVSLLGSNTRSWR